jgi:nucleoside-diphosphate-sugar epimerase
MAQVLAILGASSQLASDLILSMVAAGRSDLLLYVRGLEDTQKWVDMRGLNAHCRVLPYEQYGEVAHDAVLNFVGVGDPRRALDFGISVFEITERFDRLILKELICHPQRRYIFLSSGAVYGNSFREPVTAQSCANIPVNAIGAKDWYAAAKLRAELGHRALTELPIIDLRVFNYFSRTQDLSARFLITDIVRAVRNNEVLRVSSDFIVRDFLHPRDFHQLVECVLAAPPVNMPLDCYSAAPIDKPTLLNVMGERFGLRYEESPVGAVVAPNATGAKSCYYSLNRRAEEFGYHPAYSSLTGVLQEAAAILG